MAVPHYFRYASASLRTESAFPALGAAVSQPVDLQIDVRFAGAGSSVPEPSWQHAWKTAAGATTLQLGRLAHGWVLRAPDVADFVVAADRTAVAIHPRVGVHPETVEHLLIDQVLPRVVEGPGDFVLHACAIRVDGAGVLIVGESGTGKSTLAAAFDDLCQDVIGDDCVLVHARVAKPQVESVYPGLRLRRDVRDRFYPERCRDRSPSYGDKYRIPLTAPSEKDRHLPVGVVYALDGPAAHQRGIKIAPIFGADACMVLTKHTFRLDPTDKAGVIGLLTDTARLAQAVPLFSLSIPRNLDRVTHYAEEILDHARCAIETVAGIRRCS